jgi:large subunit ribosomal protein L29
MDIDKVRNLTDTELMTELVTERRALYDLRFQLATRQLTDHSQLSRTRRSIARLLTVMTERSLDETMLPRTAPASRAATRGASAKAAARTSAAKKDGAAKSAPAGTAAAKRATGAAKTAAVAAKGDEE